MKLLLNITRVIVGVLFIFSGLVKANDPLGLSYKMQEFFAVWGWNFLDQISLALSILMIIFEIVAGVAVLVGWQMKIFSWLLLLLTIFFTFLTGYAFLSGKVKECGCFGDCIPLQANESFYKDLVLLVLVGFLFVKRRYINPFLPVAGSVAILGLSAVFSFALQWFVLEHLPLVDCLPYKVGNNIPEKMKIPPGAIPDSIVVMYTYEKNGREIKFSATNFPADFDDSYKFIARHDDLVRKGNAEAPIKDFSLKTFWGNDTTQALLQEPVYQLYLFVKDGYQTGEWAGILNMVVQTADQKNIATFMVTNLRMDDLRTNGPGVFHHFIPLWCDATAIKTADRANPTLYLVKNGTILHKWGYGDFDRALGTLSGLEKNPAP